MYAVHAPGPPPVLVDVVVAPLIVDDVLIVAADEVCEPPAPLVAVKDWQPERSAARRIEPPNAAP